MANGTIKKSSLSAETNTLASSVTEQNPFTFTASSPMFLIMKTHINAGYAGFIKMWINTQLYYERSWGAGDYWDWMPAILNSGDTLKIALQTNANDSTLYLLG